MKPSARARRRAPRSDARVNRERVLAAATAAVRRAGEQVPMAEIAAEAGVGVGTVYRHFPTRRDLLAGLTARSFALVLDNARSAAEHDGPAVDALRRFLGRAVEYRDELVLPLHGGPAELDDESHALQREVRDHISAILRRGCAEGSVREAVSAADVIIAGAQLASALPHVADWDAVAARQIEIFLAGLATVQIENR